MSRQEWSATRYSDSASFVAQHGKPVMALLNPQPGERILDLGCGDGALTVGLVQAGALVHGVDASESMVAAAVARGLDAEVGNGEALAFDSCFDAVFSNAALHWMTDYAAVIAGVHLALRPGGRFVAELGGDGNVAALVAAMQTIFVRHADFGEFRNPWLFPSVGQYRTALENGGFEVRYIARVERPTPLKSGVRAWLQVFAEGITRSLEPAQKAQFLDEVETLLRPTLFSEGEGWVADYVRLRIDARKV